MAYTPGITEERNVKLMPARAGAAIGKYRILQAGTDPDEVIQATAGTQYPIGVSGNNSENPTVDDYAENSQLEVKVEGVVYIKMSGAGARGDRVMGHTSGMGLKHLQSDGVYIIGHALQLWADGDIIAIQIDRYMITNFENS